MVNKKFLRLAEKMDAAGYVDHAREMAKALEDRESATIGSRPVARQRIARIAGVSTSLLHSLRYRPPKTIAADAYARLCGAVEAQAIEQIRKAFDEIASARARRPGVDDRALVEIADALEQARTFLKGEITHG